MLTVLSQEDRNLAGQRRPTHGRMSSRARVQHLLRSIEDRPRQHQMATDLPYDLQVALNGWLASRLSHQIPAGGEPEPSTCDDCCDPAPGSSFGNVTV
jgi:hypothetical protein